MALFPLSVYFSFSPHWGLCPRGGGGCYNKWGSCTYRGLVCCLCRHPLRHSPRSHFFPCCSHPRSSARLWHGVGRAEAFTQLALGFMALWLWELKQLHSCQKSGLLLWHCLSKYQQWPLPPYLDHSPGPQTAFCVPAWSLFPGHGCHKSSAKLWHGVSGAMGFTQLRLGSTRRQ